jgi:hypothetical protein
MLRARGLPPARFALWQASPKLSGGGKPPLYVDKWLLEKECPAVADSAGYAKRFVISWFLIICFDANGSM